MNAESPVCFEDVAEGDEAPPDTLVREVSRTDWVVYAGASGDHNPMHSDEVAAKAAGLPSVFGHGMFTAGVLASALHRRYGVGSLRRFKVRFARQVWPGEAMTAMSKVIRKYEQDGQGLVDLECGIVNQRGEVTITGEATAALRRRG